MSAPLATLGEVLSQLEPSIGSSDYGEDEITDLLQSIDKELHAVVAAAGIDPSLFPVRVPKGRITAVLACPAKVLAELGSEIEPIHSLRGAVADVAAVGAAMSPRKPFELIDVLEAVAAIDPENPGIDMWRNANREEKNLYRERLEPLSASVQTACAGVPQDWVVRPQFTSQVPFVDGKVLATARYDMLLSKPGIPRSAVVVEVKAGAAHSDHRADAFLYALIESLRSGYSPLAIVTISTGDIPVLVEAVNGGVLEAASRRLVAAAKVLVSMVAHPNEAPAQQPGPHCMVCPLRGSCPSVSPLVAGGSRD